MKKTLTIFMAMAMICAMLCAMIGYVALADYDSGTWDGPAPPDIGAWAGDNNTIQISDGATGTLTVPAAPGLVVDIEGDITNATGGITLNIGAGATVHWNADLTGSTNNYLITATGGGKLTIAAARTIVNDGRGGAMEVTGGLDIDVYGTIASGGTVASSDTAGNAMRISGNGGATVNVHSGGAIISKNGNSNTSLYIGSNVMGVNINVNGGSVVSEGSGYAICDGTSFTTGSSNDTIITVDAGQVTAGSACAIRSSGTDSKVVVNGGVVSNAAGNNANPTIYMNAGTRSSPVGPADVNVTVADSGKVESTSSAGYAVQTVGSVEVSGSGEIVAGGDAAGSGRAVNLVGMYSRAVVSGTGWVHTTGSGTAISTATTDTGSVRYASVEVLGGRVSSESGQAINVTGSDAKVTVSGGVVSSATNHAINAGGANAEIEVSGKAEIAAVSGNAINTVAAATNASITVSGDAKVHAVTGRAIQALGTGSSVTVSGNSQVWVFTEGNAIRSSGRVTLLGGFIFAYGPTAKRTFPDGRVVTYVDAAKVISAATLAPIAGGTPVLVVAWDADNGKRLYPEGSSLTNNADLGNTLNGSSSNYWWEDDGGAGGIKYSLSTLNGFFPLPGVAIVDDFSLKLDTDAGTLETIAVPPQDAYGQYTAEETPWNWRITGDTLKLDDFHWSPSLPISLEIASNNVTIELVDGNDSSFVSAFSSTANHIALPTENSYGINSTGGSVTITGDGTLTATGGNVRYAGISAGIIAASATVAGGTLDAAGGVSAARTAGIIANSIRLTGGTLIATGGAGSVANGATEPGLSFGVDCPDFQMTGGVLIASGHTGAFRVAPVKLPSTYIYWVDSSNPVFYSEGGGGVPYVFNAAHKYVKIVAIDDVADFVYADIRDAIVSGKKYEQLIVQTATIQLHGITANIPPGGCDAGGWFARKPDGVTVRAESIDGGRAIRLTFSGAPLDILSAAFEIAIPVVWLARAQANPLVVAFNQNARFAIGEAALYALTIRAGAGGAVSGTDSGEYYPGTGIEGIATANNGYVFTGWSVTGATIPGGTGADRATFDMPANAVTLTANFTSTAQPPGETTPPPDGTETPPPDGTATPPGDATPTPGDTTTPPGDTSPTPNTTKPPGSPNPPGSTNPPDPPDPKNSTKPPNPPDPPPASGNPNHPADPTAPAGSTNGRATTDPAHPDPPRTGDEGGDGIIWWVMLAASALAILITHVRRRFHRA